MSLVNKVLTKLRFSKNWNNKSDFPTYEMREEQVRADIQLLHDETQTAFNNLVDDLNSLSAENIPFESSTGVPASNLQAAVENVQQQVAEAYAETAIPNGSVTSEKLAPNVLPGKADLVDGIVKADQMRFRIKTLDGLAHTLGSEDIGYLMLARYLNSGGSEQEINIPTDSTSIPVGSVFMFSRMSPVRAIKLTFDSESVDVYSGAMQWAGTLRFTGDEGIVLLVKLSATEWMLAVMGAV